MSFFRVLSFVLIGMSVYTQITVANEKDHSIENHLKIVEDNDLILKRHALAPVPKSKNMIIVSCSGKCGSTTLETSFKAINIETRRFHTIEDSLFEFIMQRQKRSVVVLFDSVRDPISRKIASFFQNLSQHVKLTQEEIVAAYQEDPAGFLQFLQEKFNFFLLKIEYGNTFSFWKKFKYDCLKEGKFDFKKKYQMMRKGNLYFINLRFDDISKWEKIIKSINIPFDLKNFKIIPSNMAQDKWYAGIYKDFLAEFRLSRTDFEVILSSVADMLSHFYKQSEIEALKARWEPHLY